MTRKEVYKLPYFEYLTLVETMNLENQYQERETNKTQQKNVALHSKKNYKK